MRYATCIAALFLMAALTETATAQCPGGQCAVRAYRAPVVYRQRIVAQPVVTQRTEVVTQSVRVAPVPLGYVVAQPVVVAQPAAVYEQRAYVAQPAYVEQRSYVKVKQKVGQRRGVLNGLGRALFGR